MAISITICNLALGDVRSKQIQDVGEDTLQASVCRDLYPHCLSIMLDDYYWQFTKRIADLAQLATNDRASEWAYAYALPSDFGQAIRLMPTGAFANTWVSSTGLWRDVVPSEWWKLFIVEAGSLYCNLSPARLEYSSNMADEADFPPLFREALRRLLAANLSVPLRDDPAMEARFMQMAARARDQAIANDRNRAPKYDLIDDVALARR